MLPLQDSHRSVMKQNLIASTIATALILVLLDHGDAKNFRRPGSRSIRTLSNRVKGIKSLKARRLGDLKAADKATKPLARELQAVTGGALEEGDTGIIGGAQASGGEYPFYVKFEGNTLCGGSLISPDTVLTAAHCVSGGTPNQIRVGTNEYSDGGVVANVQCSVTHKDFEENESTLKNDVAIIKLKQSITDSGVATIDYNKDTTFPGTDGTPLTVIGFGLTDVDGSVSNTLQELTTSFVSIDKCIATYPNNVVTAETHICADIKNAGDCNGDSGGPVLIDGVQVGIVSFGYGGCASNQYQDVYVNVATYSDWITSYVLGANCRALEDTSSGTGDSGTGGTADGSTKPGNPTDTGNGGTEDSGTPNTDPEVEIPEEEPSDIDTLIECFTSVLDFIQGMLGIGKDNKGGGNQKEDEEEDDTDDVYGTDDEKDAGKGGGNDKGANKDQGKGEEPDQGGGATKGTFMRNFLFGEDGEGGIVGDFLNGDEDADVVEYVSEGDHGGGER